MAAAAGVRPSHLTYYVPERDDLLEAVAARAVESIPCQVRRVVEWSGSTNDLFEALAESVADLEHMRMSGGSVRTS